MQLLGAHPARLLLGARIDEVILSVRGHGLHELRVHGDRDVEVLHHRGLGLHRDELPDLGVGVMEYPHIGPAPGAALLNLLGGVIVHL